MKKLFKTLENINPSLHIVAFVCQIPKDSGKKIDSVSKLVKIISKIGKVQEFPAFKSWDENKVCDWIKHKNSESKEIKSSKDASLALLRSTGTELRRLDSEIAKLKLSVYLKKSTIQDIADLCGTQDNIFLLADYWLKSNDKTNAIIELNKLFEKLFDVIENYCNITNFH